MKNLVSLFMVLLSFSATAQSIASRGTGRTTGHIITLSIHNPTDSPITAYIPPSGNMNEIMTNGTPIFQDNEHRGSMFFIPSGHSGHQSYVGVSSSPPTGVYPGTIQIQPGDTLHVGINGYCADIHSPPVPLGENAPPISSWIGGEGNIPPSASGIPDGFAPARKPETMPYVASNVPNQMPAKPLTISLDKYPAGAEYLFHAIREITQTYDSLYRSSQISTPFSGNARKERESVIQQTFWIYTSSLTGEPYSKEEFHGRMLAQYENSTETKIEDAPAAVSEKIDQGVDDFWSTFTTVGLEAKVFSANESYPYKDQMEDAFGSSDQSGVRAQTDSAAAAAAGAISGQAIAKGSETVAGSSDTSTIQDEPVHSANTSNEGVNSAISAAAEGRDSTSAKGALSGAAIAGAKAEGTSGNSSEKTETCACGDLKAEITIPGLNRGNNPQSVTTSTNTEKVGRIGFVATQENLSRLRTVKVRVDKLELNCTCNNSPCPVTPTPKSFLDTFSGDGTAGDEDSKYKIQIVNSTSAMRLVAGQENKQFSNGSAEWEFERPRPNAMSQSRTIKLEVEASCGSNSCTTAKCLAIIEVVIDMR